jgi:alpha-tubulin suppressor-like RCC1 family protein
VAVKNSAGTGPLTGVTDVSARGIRACALLSNHTAQCWGYNTTGQLGDGTTTARHLPVVVKNVAGTGPLTGVTQIGLGTYYSCAVVSGGTADCWGTNTGGQLGDGTTTNRHLPVVVKGSTGSGALSGIGAVSAGADHTCALMINGRVDCWGTNSSGQLGDGTTTNRRLPVVVENETDTGPLMSVVQISVRDVDSCVTETNGTAICWGGNGYGQLGDGTTTPRHLPVDTAMQ